MFKHIKNFHTSPYFQTPFSVALGDGLHHGKNRPPIPMGHKSRHSMKMEVEQKQRRALRARTSGRGGVVRSGIYEVRLLV